MLRYGTARYAPHIREEVDKVRRSLNSLRLATPEEKLHPYFMLNEEELNELKNEYQDQSTINFHFFDINELLQKSGSARKISSPFSDLFFVYQLLKKRPSNYYATSTERRYFTFRNMRIVMLVSSAILMISSLIWGGYNFMGGLDHKQNVIQAETKSKFYNTRYQIAREGLPEVPVEPAGLKVAVELHDNLSNYKSTPLQTIRLVSLGLNKFPTIKLNNFRWAASIDPNLKVGSSRSAVNQGVVGFSNVNSDDLGYLYYQIANIDCDVAHFDGNYRQAISLINEFAEILREKGNVHDVSILTFPLDVRSTSIMQGNTESKQRDAKFSIRLVLGIRA